jgi:DNA-binding CsgD family transcriptional regulator
MLPISPDRLTEAQRVALRMFMERMTAKEIGRQLGISPKAVELRLKGARDTLGVMTSAEAARILAAHEDNAFRNTLGGRTEVAERSPRGLSAADDGTDGTTDALSDQRAAVRTAQWIKAIDWPIRSQRRTENDLSLTQRLLWPLLIIIGTLIGLGILINSIATLSQVALNIFGPR